MNTNDIDTLLMKELDEIAESKGYIDEARAMLENTFVDSSVPVKSRVVYWGVLAGGLAAAAAVLLLFISSNSIYVKIADDGRVLAGGSWVSSPADNDLLLSFSDGSEMKLEKDSEVRLQNLDENGAHLLLERGKVAVSVIHRSKTKWRLDAGPYKINVTGTKFSAQWIPDRKMFLVNVDEGSIIVEGPMLTTGKALSKTESLHVSLLERVVEVFKADTYERIVSSDNPDSDDSFGAQYIAQEESKISDNTADVQDETGSAIETAILSGNDQIMNSRILDSAKKTGRVQDTSGKDLWKSIAARGEWSKAVEEAEKFGLKTIVSSSSLSDLMLLGDAARLSGKNVRSMQVYKAVRVRFPKTSESQRAAFAMGRIEFESYANYQNAAAWFRQCINDDTGGAVAREAYGRLMESLDRAGDRQGATRSAEQYLKMYKNGPHSRLAKQILAKTDL